MSAHSRALEVPAGVFSAAVTAPGADTRRGDFLGLQQETLGSIDLCQ